MTNENGTASGRQGHPASALHLFAQGLRDLRAAAGSPSYRAMERKTGCPAYALSAAASGDALPSLVITQAYVEACDGDQEEWTRSWHSISARLERRGRHAAHDTVEFPRATRPDPLRRTPSEDLRVMRAEPPQPLSGEDLRATEADPSRPLSGEPLRTTSADQRQAARSEAPPVPPVEPPGATPAQPPRQGRRRNSVKVWVIAGALAQAGLLAAALLRPSPEPTPASAAQAEDQPTAGRTAQPQSSGGRTGQSSERRTGQPSEGRTAQPGQQRSQQTPAGTESRTQRTPAPGTQPTPAKGKAGAVSAPRPAFAAIAGPGCPRDTSRTVNINGVPGRSGWKDAEAPGWTGAGCGEGFLFSELTFDPKTAEHPRNVFQWRFTTGLRGPRQCLVGVYVPKSGLAGQRVWYTVRDGFDDDARTIGEFTLDQRMRQGTWVPAPVPVTVASGLVMVEIKDTGSGNTTGDQSMAAGPVRLACL